MNEDERLEMVESVKWVDEVLTGVPYDLTPEFLDELFHKHKIDYVIHGDDPCLMPDGTDAYAYAKKAGRFRMVRNRKRRCVFDQESFQRYVQLNDVHASVWCRSSAQRV